MNVTIYSFLVATLWCNVFICILAVLHKKDALIKHFSITPLLFLAGVCISRLLCFFEFPYTRVLPSTHILPSLLVLFRTPLFDGADGHWGPSPAKLLFGIWLLGSTFLAVRFVKRLIESKNIVTIGKELRNTHVNDLMAEVMAPSGKNTNVRLIRSPEITVPMIVGFFKPIIYLPDVSLNKKQLRGILTHEWTHFLYKDIWIKLFISILEIVFWWNPFIFVFKANVNHIMEMRCDLQVTKHMDEASKAEYMDTILMILKYHTTMQKRFDITKQINSAALVSTKKESKIEQRFQLMFNQKDRKDTKVGVLLLYTMILVSYLLSNAFVIQPHGENPADYGYEESFSITAQNTYLIDNNDGTFSVYVDGTLAGIVKDTEIAKEPLALLTVK